MAKGESFSGRLLSKVARFVRNPTKDWSELDHKEPEPDSGYSKESLKEMIERKRQNDFVRKREFDHLRKLRRRDPQLGSDQTGRPSFFLSSVPSNLDDRAETLKKIDEIEAQMSKQWWKGRQDEAQEADAGSPSIAAKLPQKVPPATGSGGGRPPEDSKFESTQATALGVRSDWGHPSIEFSPTQTGHMATEPGPTYLLGELQFPGSKPNPPAPLSSGGEGAHGDTSFGISRQFAMELTDSLTDPDLEEAAIRFANADDAGAEAGLLKALQGESLRPELAEAWMAALFDLYRATGQQARFDSVAIDFANRFGRSAPAWFSTPDLLGSRKGESAQAGAGVATQEPIWLAPPELTLASLVQLRALLQRHAAPWHLDWSALATIAAEAVDNLDQLFVAWCDMPVQLVCSGCDNFHAVLRAATPQGDNRVNPKLWQLRMDALRVMNLQDEFELVALDYCVTFEVSPPSWQDVRCHCVVEGSGAVTGGSLESVVRADMAGPGQEMAGDATQFELAGVIEGDPRAALLKLEAGLDGGKRLVISCERLIRVDFTAAGSILNWVIDLETRGCQVQFREVNRIVVAFFNVIGISEHARVVPRST